MASVAASLQNIFAPVLVGTWLCFMAYTLELVLAFQYFSNKHLRSPGANTTIVWWIVVFQLFVDTLGAMGAAAYAYLFLVSHWGDLAFMTQTTNPWPSAIYCFTSGFSGLTVQLYLIWRYSILSKNYVVCGILALGTIVAFGGALGAGVTAITHTHPTESLQKHIRPISMVWFIGSAVTDIAIATALVFKLQTFKSTFKRTRSVIHRLIVIAIQTGSATSVVASLVLITFLVWPNTTIPFAPGFVLGRLYGCTLLFNLTTRRMGDIGNSSERSDDHLSFPASLVAGTGTSGAPRDRSGREGDRPTRLDTLGGIHVHQIVQVDKGRLDAQDMDARDDVSVGDRKKRPGVI
ncbi:hypothetical protein MIND_01413500 [Mycena indigotica]|uniref:DUF6534 domain-containing protein n=1 Tax=Mycena indigotica TaxID=2126181 RepID=A0A8H6VUR4_9AGAR|nr:uncharacterized protein MIND_01413500 [Mycena indigotica]KAF7288969.1 hypothetical protein MIND_01413500 [Mycena indigotica]